jgi:hypothetical protein
VSQFDLLAHHIRSNICRHETTSSAFTWVTYLLATHPDIQTRLREEIRQNLPSNPGPEVDLAAVLESLPLLNAVCNETLRLYPTVPITIRDVVRDTSIIGQFVPKGTQVLLVPCKFPFFSVTFMHNLTFARGNKPFPRPLGSQR